MTNSDWISVEERLPEVNTPVMVSYTETSLLGNPMGRSTRIGRVGYQFNGEKCWSLDTGNPLLCSNPEVTHWMELPPASDGYSEG